MRISDWSSDVCSSDLPYGNFIPNAAGYAQVITGVGGDGIPNTSDDIVISGTPVAPVGVSTAIRTDSAFLADIAHTAVPNGLADGDIEIGLLNPGNNPEIGRASCRERVCQYV